MRHLPDHEANLQVLILAEYSPEVAEIFVSQYFEIRGPWQLEDWRDRMQATNEWYEKREWSEESQKWM